MLTFFLFSLSLSGRNLPNWILFSLEVEETASGPLGIVSRYFIICWPDCQYNLLFIIFYKPPIWMLGFHKDNINRQVRICFFPSIFVDVCFAISLAKCKSLSIPALCVFTFAGVNSIFRNSNNNNSSKNCWERWAGRTFHCVRVERRFASYIPPSFSSRQIICVTFLFGCTIV